MKTLRPSIVAVLSVLAAPVVAGEMPQDALIAALKSGGHVIYLRHTSTESDYADQITADPANCASQRVLSEKGWTQARDIGQAVQRLHIPVDEVISSEYCRAWQTADLAFGHYSKTAALNFEPAETYTDAQLARMRNRVSPLINAPLVAGGGNRVIVGHDDPFEAVTGIYPEPQGVAYLLRPDGAGSFTVLGHIDPDAWPNS